MDKKPNKIHENLIPTKINNHTIATVLANSYTTIKIQTYLITGQPS